MKNKTKYKVTVYFNHLDYTVTQSTFICKSEQAARKLVDKYAGNMFVLNIEMEEI